MIKANELIKLMAETKPTAVVEGDEACYVRPKAEIDVDDEGLCRLSVGQEIPSNPDLGHFEFEVGGVTVSVGRGIDGPEGDFEFEGTEIAYGDLSVEDLVAAIRAHVKFPELSEFEFRYNDTAFDPDDVEESIETDIEVFAEDEDGDIYAFDSKDDVEEGMEVIDSDEAIHRLVEVWSESDGETDGSLVNADGSW